MRSLLGKSSRQRLPPGKARIEEAGGTQDTANDRAAWRFEQSDRLGIGRRHAAPGIRLGRRLFFRDVDPGHGSAPPVPHGIVQSNGEIFNL